jgi:hypothetical protein
LIAIQWHSGGGKIACTEQFGQIANGIHGNVNRFDLFAATMASVTNNSPAKLFFVFPRTRVFLFLVKKIFVCDEK